MGTTFRPETPWEREVRAYREIDRDLRQRSRRGSCAPGRKGRWGGPSRGRSGDDDPSG